MTQKAEEMTEYISSQLEDLSVEILIEIFGYLTPHELYSSFAQLNIRFNSILNSLPNLILTTNTHSDPVLSFFKSFIAIRIRFRYSIPSCLSQFPLSKFIGIRSFDIRLPSILSPCTEEIDQFDRILRPDLCPRLEFLRLPDCSPALMELIFTGAFSYLKIFHVGQCDAPILPATTIPLEAFRRLAIKEQNGSDADNIISMCPNLRSFIFTFHDKIPQNFLCARSYPFLKHLRFARARSFLFYDGQFDFFLSHFPNLLNFAFTVRQCHQHDETLDFAKLADCLRQRLPRLKTLSWRIYMTERNRYSIYTAQFQLISRMHPLFKCFGKCDSLLHIASYDFTSKYRYPQHFVHPSS